MIKVNDAEREERFLFLLKEGRLVFNLIDSGNKLLIYALYRRDIEIVFKLNKHINELYNIFKELVRDIYNHHRLTSTLLNFSSDGEIIDRYDDFFEENEFVENLYIPEMKAQRIVRQSDEICSTIQNYILIFQDTSPGSYQEQKCLEMKLNKYITLANNIFSDI